MRRFLYGRVASFFAAPARHMQTLDGAAAPKEHSAADAAHALHKASAFTGKPDFYEALFFLQDVLKRVQSVSRASGSGGGSVAASAPVRIPWYSQTQMADRIGFSLNKLQYRQIRSVLGELAAYMRVGEVRDFLRIFSPAHLDEVVDASVQKTQALLAKYSNREPDLGCIDSLGRAVSIGRRKAASAKVFVVPGTGECYVNGRPAIEYFKRLHEMCRIADPFSLTGTLAKYNAWCLVRGGGLSGQSGAIAHALAKAIVLLEPQHKSSLEQNGLLRRDPRVVERKKPGQPKARKKFTWVKR